jgi:hypothetical protein
LFEHENKHTLAKFIHSNDWKIARTIYSTLSISGRVAIEPMETGKMELKAEITSIDI